MAGSWQPGSLQGRLLVAEPALRDPNFERTVVYVLEHHAGGALGLVLNRPGPVAVHQVVPEWAPYVRGIDRVFVGGPVTPEGAVCLARAGPGAVFELIGPDLMVGPEPGHGPVRGLTPTIGIVDLRADPADAPAGIEALRVFAGYAGWSAGQLEDELAAGGWYVLDPQDADIFTEAPDHLWRLVLSRQPGELRARAHYPRDPGWN